MKDRIRTIRKNLGVNQTEFGELVGCSQTAIAKYETGIVIPDKPLRLLICEKFHVNETWLETGEGEPYKAGVRYEVLRCLDAMPALQRKLARLLPRLTRQDLKAIDALVEKLDDAQPS